MRHNLSIMTGVTDPNEIGIVGDDKHGVGYHLGVATIKRLGNYPDSDYSTRQPRDRVGGDTASAMDVTLSWVNGGRDRAIKWSNNLVALSKAGHLPEIRAINYLNTSGQKRRWDSFFGTDGPSSDDVDIHTHIEWWRDTEGYRDFSLLLDGSMADWTQSDIDNTTYTLFRNSNGPIHARLTDMMGKIAQIQAGIGQPVQVDTAGIATAVAEALAADQTLAHITDADVSAIAEKTRATLASHLGS